eukprot:56078-Eustigmatos_ZCMA.PRE.1
MLYTGSASHLTSENTIYISPTTAGSTGLGINTSGDVYTYSPLYAKGSYTSSSWTSSGKWFSRVAVCGTQNSTCSTSVGVIYASIICSNSIWINNSTTSSNGNNSFVAGNSDRRCKENISIMDTQKALQKIRAIQPVEF